MKIGIGLVIVCAVIGGVVMHQHREGPTTLSPAVPAAPEALASPHPPSQHNWPKSALDRAADVKKQVTKHREQTDRD